MFPQQTLIIISNQGFLLFNLLVITKMAYREKQVQTRLHGLLGGLTEVYTPVGRIDILTDSELIEIKWANNWKEGVGQLLTYSHYYPQHKRRLHIFDSTDDRLIGTIKDHCTRLGILLTVEPEQLINYQSPEDKTPKKDNWQIHSKLIPSVIYYWCTWGSEPNRILPNWRVDIDTDPYSIYCKSYNLPRKSVAQWEEWLKLTYSLN